MLLQGIPDHVDGFLLSGARVSEETKIRQFSELREFNIRIHLTGLGSLSLVAGQLRLSKKAT